MITYICKYTPVELLCALGAQPEEPNEEVTDFAQADALIHSSVCSHAKQLLTVLTQDVGRGSNTYKEAESSKSQIRDGRSQKESGSGEIPDCEKCDRSGGKSGREVVLTNCCDSIRRVYDTLMAEKRTRHRSVTGTAADAPVVRQGTEFQDQEHPLDTENENTAPGPKTFGLETSEESAREVRHSDEFMFMMDLPHNNMDYSVGTYTKELERLLQAYQVYSGHTCNRDRFLFEWKKSAAAWKRLNETEEEFIAVIGARAGRGLLEMFESSLPVRIVDFTCGGVRMMSDPPENAEDLSMEELLRVYAKTLLSQIPCMRMQDIHTRKILTNRPNLRGIIYHTVRFCDYYSFEYASLCKEVSVPMLKLESDYTFQSEGQLSTRIEAFRESLGLKSKNDPAGVRDEIRKTVDRNRLLPKERAISGRDRENEKEPSVMYKDNLDSNELNNTHSDRTAPDADSVYVGIDSGSTSTNCVAIDGKGNILASEILRTGARAGDAAERVLQSVRRQLGDRADQIRRVMATGYGREFITIADGTKTEISCHAKGAHSINPEARTVIDIGGQDSKVICLDENGNVANFIMNDKCAAGTGRFLEMMSHTLEMDISEMAGRGIKWKKDLTISSVCTVFAESEVVSLIAENNDTDDIIHALAKSVASKTCSMVRRARGKGPFMMTGGVARNRAVTGEIEAKLGEKLYIGKEPDLTGAIGAALFAAEAML